jgi:hypothetical protein
MSRHLIVRRALLQAARVQSADANDWQAAAGGGISGASVFDGDAVDRRHSRPGRQRLGERDVTVDAVWRGAVFSGPHFGRVFAVAVRLKLRQEITPAIRQHRKLAVVIWSSDHTTLVDREVYFRRVEVSTAGIPLKAGRFWSVVSQAVSPAWKLKFASKRGLARAKMVA